MAALDPLLKFVDERPKPTLIALMGVIVSGSVAGGLVIHSLENQLSTREQLEKARLALVESKYENKFAEISANVAKLKSRVDDLAIETDYTRETLHKVA